MNNILNKTIFISFFLMLLSSNALGVIIYAGGSYGGNYISVTRGIANQLIENQPHIFRRLHEIDPFPLQYFEGLELAPDLIRIQNIPIFGYARLPSILAQNKLTSPNLPTYQQDIATSSNQDIANSNSLLALPIELIYNILIFLPIYKIISLGILNKEWYKCKKTFITSKYFLNSFLNSFLGSPINIKFGHYISNILNGNIQVTNDDIAFNNDILRIMNDLMNQFNTMFHDIKSKLSTFKLQMNGDTTFFPCVDISLFYSS